MGDDQRERQRQIARGNKDEIAESNRKYILCRDYYRRLRDDIVRRMQQQPDRADQYRADLKAEEIKWRRILDCIREEIAVLKGKMNKFQRIEPPRDFESSIRRAGYRAQKKKKKIVMPNFASGFGSFKSPWEQGGGGSSSEGSRASSPSPPSPPPLSPTWEEQTKQKQQQQDDSSTISSDESDFRAPPPPPPQQPAPEPPRVQQIVEFGADHHDDDDDGGVLQFNRPARRQRANSVSSMPNFASGFGAFQSAGASSSTTPSSSMLGPEVSSEDEPPARGRQRSQSISCTKELKDKQKTRNFVPAASPLTGGGSRSAMRQEIAQLKLAKERLDREKMFARNVGADKKVKKLNRPRPVHYIPQKSKEYEEPSPSLKVDRFASDLKGAEVTDHVEAAFADYMYKHFYKREDTDNPIFRVRTRRLARGMTANPERHRVYDEWVNVGIRFFMSPYIEAIPAHPSELPDGIGLDPADLIHFKHKRRVFSQKKDNNAYFFAHLNERQDLSWMRSMNPAYFDERMEWMMKLLERWVEHYQEQERNGNNNGNILKRITAIDKILSIKTSDTFRRKSKNFSLFFLPF